MRQVFDFIIFFIICGLANAAEKPADYAFGLPIEASGAEALYEVTLPAALYQGVTRRDLGDVRVFNGAGEVVPHALRPRRTEKADAGVRVALTLFPLKAAAGASIDGLSINVQRSAAGAMSVEVKSSEAKPARLEVAGYLIDLSAQERALRAIEVDWKAPEGFSGKLRVDASDDLSNWRTLAAAAPLLNLELGGQRLQQKRIELPQVKAKYLRLAWVSEDQTARPELTAVNGELADKIVEALREWQKFAAGKGDKDGEYIFDLKGFFPADRLRLELPDANTIAQVEVLVRDKAEQPWRSITRAVAYRLNRPGGEVVSPDIVVAASPERWWMIRIDQRGGGIGSGMPVLNAGWVPHQLVFAARGKPPFTLAYGNRGVQPGALPVASLIPGYNEDTASAVRVAKTASTPTVNVQAAAAQGQQDLGGAVRLEEQVDWKRWTLWSVLGLGVIVLGLMAARLMKQLGTSSGERKP